MEAIKEKIPVPKEIVPVTTYIAILGVTSFMFTSRLLSFKKSYDGYLFTLYEEEKAT